MDAPIELVPYDAAWPVRFAEERERIREAIGPWLTGEVEHVGSTAVPGLAAKPVIDIMAPVADLDTSRSAIAKLEAIGYCYAPYRDDVEHWFCKPRPAHRTHHLHLVPGGSRLWRDRIGWRNALRGDAALAREYAELKAGLARRHREDRDAYTDAKGPFIAEALRRPRKPPRIELVPMKRTAENFRLALTVKKEAMGPYIISRWGWDDDAQRRTLEEHWESRAFRRIVAGGETAGTVSVERKPDEWFFSDFYLFNAYQGLGIGEEVLSRFLGEAKEAGVPVVLKVIKWNPARSLYERHGFMVTAEIETHFLMRWPG
jgi:GrpB-like predicted nucleotidyltransferase (UPF0157 family)/ribosomal protein S18 acetylase RimI-like enzyme